MTNEAKDKKTCWRGLDHLNIGLYDRSRKGERI
jgi:hypothetical protein